MSKSLIQIPFPEPPASNNWPSGSIAWATQGDFIALAHQIHSTLTPGVLGIDLETHNISMWPLPSGSQLVAVLAGGGWWAATNQGLYHLRWKESPRLILPLETIPGWQLKSFVPHHPIPPYLLSFHSPDKKGARFFSIDGQPRQKQKWSLPSWAGGCTTPGKDGFWWVARQQIEHFQLAALSPEGTLDFFNEPEFNHPPVAMASSPAMNYLAYLTDTDLVVVDVQHKPSIAAIHSNQEGFKVFWIDEGHFWVVGKNRIQLWNFSSESKLLQILENHNLTETALLADWSENQGLIVRGQYSLFGIK